MSIWSGLDWTRFSYKDICPIFTTHSDIQVGITFIFFLSNSDWTLIIWRDKHFQVILYQFRQEYSIVDGDLMKHYEVSLSQNVAWHSGTWPYTMTPSIDQTLHQFPNLLPNWTLIPILTLLPNFPFGFHRTMQRVRLANRGRLLFRTPGPVPFGTCICSNVETILSWTCHVYGPFEFRTSLGTSILFIINPSITEKNSLEEQDKSSDIEQQPPFGDRQISNIQPQNRGGYKTNRNII